MRSGSGCKTTVSNGPMGLPAPNSRKSRRLMIAAAVIVLAAIIVISKVLHALKEPDPGTNSTADATAKVELVKGTTDTLDVPSEVAKTLGLTTADAQPDTTPRT